MIRTRRSRSPWFERFPSIRHGLGYSTQILIILIRRHALEYMSIRYVGTLGKTIWSVIFLGVMRKCFSLSRGLMPQVVDPCVCGGHEASNYVPWLTHVSRLSWSLQWNAGQGALFSNPFSSKFNGCRSTVSIKMSLFCLRFRD